MNNTAYSRNATLKTFYAGSNIATIKNYMIAFGIGIGHDRFPFLLELALVSRAYEKNFLLLDKAFKDGNFEEHNRYIIIEEALNNRAGWLRDMLNGIVGRKGRVEPDQNCRYCRFIVYPNTKVHEKCHNHKKTLTRETACV